METKERPSRLSQCGLIAILLSAAGLLADEPRPAARPSGNLEFSIGKQGRLILLPVEFRDRRILCVLDTGASGSAFDRTLQPWMGKPQSELTIQTPAGRQTVPRYAWPDARLGGVALATAQPVASFNMEAIRQATGEEVLGIIGMDVLKSHRLQIDFDRGRLRFLEALPANEAELGTKLSLDFAGDGVPRFIATFSDGREERFVIDTGAQGNSIEVNSFDRLVADDRISGGSSFASVTLGGMVQGDAGYLDRLALGPFTHEHLRVARVNVSSLGLRYLSRYRVLFNFPGKTAYLAQGEGFRKQEPRATSGLNLTWIEGDVVVASVLKQGPGAEIGLKPQDVLVRVNGKDAAEYDHFALREVLTSEPGRRIPLTIRRGQREFDAELVLSEK
jgi:hypothetical protein